MSIIPNNWHSSWDDFMSAENIYKQKVTLLELKNIEKQLGEIFPLEDNVLRFLQNDLDNMKAVIVGMEPYPSSFEKDGNIFPIATGRSFEIANVTDWNQKFKQCGIEVEKLLQVPHCLYNKTRQCDFFCPYFDKQCQYKEG